MKNGNSRGYLIIIVILALLNAGLLAFMYAGGGQAKPVFRGNGSTEYYLESELQLTQDQKQKYRELRETHFAQVQERHEKIRELKTLFFDQLSREPARDKALQVAKQIGQEQAAIEMLTFDHFRELRAICSPAQQQKFDEVIQDALRMGGPPPAGGAHRPGPHHGL